MKKCLSFIIKFIVFVLILAGINRVLEYILVEDYEDEFRARMHEMYNQENIDTLFLGSSHVFCSTDPRILEQMWEEDVYIAASSVQKPDVSYYLLKEAAKYYDLDRVFLDMYYFQFREEDSAERNSELLKYVYAISDYMKPSIDKFMFITDAVPRENWIRAYLPAVRYSDKLFDLEHIDAVVKAKKSDNYKNYSVGNAHKGFIELPVDYENTDSKVYWIQSSGDINYQPVSDENIKAYSRKYLDRIIDFCKEKDIELVLYCTPMTDYHLASIGNYDQYTNFVKDIANTNNIKFYDFNMFSPEYASFDDSMFGDTHHTNVSGAELFTQKLGDIIRCQKQGEDVDKYFCNSVKDKFEMQESKVFGFMLNPLADKKFSVETLANYDVADIDYQVQVAPMKDGNVTGEYTIVAEYGDGNVFSLPADGDYKIIVQAHTDSGDTFLSREFSYYEEN